MRERTPTRGELADSLGEGIVGSLEALRGMEGLDLLDRVFACVHGVAGGRAAHAEVGEAYLRARAKGTCPVLELSEFYWEHWDVDGLCGMFPCPRCAEENVYTGLLDAIAASDGGRDREDDGEDADLTIPF